MSGNERTTNDWKQTSGSEYAKPIELEISKVLQ